MTCLGRDGKGLEILGKARRVKKLTERVQARDVYHSASDLFQGKELFPQPASALKSDRRRVGVMFLNFKRHQRFDPEMRTMIEAFADKSAFSLK